MPPPEIAELPDGTVVSLRPIAERVSREHLSRHPEEIERYGAELASQWCVHDNQHVLGWAVQAPDVTGQLSWLASVLDARGYPVANLVECAQSAARALAEAVPSEAGRAAAARLQSAAIEVGARYS